MNNKPALEFLNSIDPVAAESLKQLRQKAPELVDVLIERLYGEAYQRDKLTLRERAFVTIASLAASGNMNPQLATQIRLALKIGATREELMEVIYQISVFSGLGCATNAMIIIDAVADKVEADS